jgi:hypothetical protein
MTARRRLGAALPGFELLAGPIAPDGAAGDEWYTPAEILAWLGRIALDPCWSPSCAVKAAAVLDARRGDDGLAHPWAPVGAGVVFVNPPFSNTRAWLRRCRLQARVLGRVVVALVPAVPGDGPWRDEVWPEAVAVGFLSGRVEFTNPDGEIEQKGRGHALVLYGPEAACLAVARAISTRARKSALAPRWVRQWQP